jgi:excisionase family DNA binding protein
MPEDKLLTVRDVSLMLGVFEKDVLDLAEKGVIPAYKIGGLYLRFKKEQVEQYRKSHQQKHPESRIEEKDTLVGRLRDFLYFNDFYILAVFLIGLLVFLVYRGL